MLRRFHFPALHHFQPTGRAVSGFASLRYFVGHSSLLALPLRIPRAKGSRAHGSRSHPHRQKRVLSRQPRSKPPAHRQSSLVAVSVDIRFAVAQIRHRKGQCIRLGFLPALPEKRQVTGRKKTSARSSGGLPVWRVQPQTPVGSAARDVFIVGFRASQSSPSAPPCSSFFRPVSPSGAFWQCAGVLLGFSPVGSFPVASSLPFSAVCAPRLRPSLSLFPLAPAPCFVLAPVARPRLRPLGLPFSAPGVFARRVSSLAFSARLRSFPALAVRAVLLGGFCWRAGCVAFCGRGFGRSARLFSAAVAASGAPCVVLRAAGVRVFVFSASCPVLVGRGWVVVSGSVASLPS